MDIYQFFELFVGRWRSQRSDHQFGEGNGGDIRSLIEITSLSHDDPDLIAACQEHNVAPNIAIHPMRMTWEEESLSNKKPKGTAVIIPIPNDVALPQKGLILGGQNKSVYDLGVDEALTIQTVTAQGAIAERIWYGNPNLRFRVATFSRGDHKSDRKNDHLVQSSKFYSEIRSATAKT